jgi:hypothetical protein
MFFDVKQKKLMKFLMLKHIETHFIRVLYAFESYMIETKSEQ